mmetsp:Transcript_22000/g.28478  ORF Transcript_22000/g.28478 Transcript_22000/m.28478 type:complete len:549 (-) Transcript_22000:218-1864(-)|eukprot:CAMPEP_0198142736 /NCGR_PEP_ID=MMETSP1443-20131203/5452_1 /TAXON_ID=186043 /ORGANISM="Entomoneis sp., Strain CCMP2396" /LENGTH=548 /DNA_ID=CAMNT_0043805819 /DNA_START=210 /DNA_END=1856 /DNA_ORIENTATION=+
MSKYQVYQIDFSAVAAGKHVASTKRRIRWRFGYPSREALEGGQTGQSCRGEEHEVVIVWSVTSGKRQLVMDGKEVHYSSNRTGVLEHSWTAKGNHVYKVICHAAPPVSAVPGFRQYDLFIDGLSFFSMPKVYELGLRGGTGGRSPGVRTSAPPAPRSSAPPAPKSSTEEEIDLQRAIQASLEESKQHLQKKQQAVAAPSRAPPAPFGDTDDLMSLGMGDPTQPAYDSYNQQQQYSAPPSYQQPPPAYSQPAPAYQQPPPSYYQQPSPVTYPTSNAGAGSYPALPPSSGQQEYYAPAAPAPPAEIYYPPAPEPASYTPAPYLAPVAEQNIFDNNYSSAPAPVPNQFDSFGVSDDPFAPKPRTHNDISSGIMSAYGPSTPASTAGPPAGMASPPPYGQTPNGNSRPVGTPQTNGDGGGLTMLQFEEEEPLNPFDLALRNLVNVDHIDQPASSHLKSNMKKEKEEEEKQKKKGKSKGLPPAAANVVGNQASLAQIGEVKQKNQPSKTVMKAPPQLFSPQAAQAGMLVVYGDKQNGPPPIQRQGFGVGYNRQ